MPLDPKRTVRELRELQELTGNADGAQRVAWTDTWVAAQEWMAGKLDGIEMEFDEARNQWWTLPGVSDKVLVIGGHLDSVPNGGWLDGALNVVAGSEVLRRLVSWADEEGARFGRSLFGSSAAAGSMADQDELRGRKDAEGVSLPDAIGPHGVDLDSALEARKQLENAAAYLELHIEQGPVLERAGIDLGIVTGIVGLLGFRARFVGEANHAGTTPMELRRDALAGASRAVLSLRDEARGRDDMTANVGMCTVEPGGFNVIPGVAEFSVDVRSPTAEGFSRAEQFVRTTLAAIAEEEGLDLELEETHRLQPVPLDSAIQDVLERAAEHEGATHMRLPSGAGHDAMIVGRHVPAGMLFVPSRGGISHSPAEYTAPEQCELGARVLARALAELVA